MEIRKLYLLLINFKVGTYTKITIKIWTGKIFLVVF